MSTEQTPEHVLVAVRIGELLEATGIAHMICGSLASSIHGEPRSSHDIDIVIDAGEGDVEGLCHVLQSDFHIDDEAVRVAVESRTSCNVIHVSTGIKVDLFPLRPREYSRVELDRRSREVAIPPDRTLSITSPEDMVLTKLEWFRNGGEVSDRQWRDVTGILKLQADRLDVAYLEKWASDLGIRDLLDRARADAGQH